MSILGWSWQDGVTNLQFLQGEHVFENHDLVKLGRFLDDGLDVVVVPVREFANTTESVWEQAPCELANIPIQALGSLLNLLLFLLAALGSVRRLGLSRLVGVVGDLNEHRSTRGGHSKTELGLVKHLNCQTDRFGTEINNECLAFEVSIGVMVHLDLSVTTVDLLCNDSIFGEQVANFLLRGIEGNPGHPHSGVVAGLGGFRLFDL